MIAERVGRLEAMIGELDEIAAAEAEEAADRASFDPGAGFERFDRRQARLGRELLGTVEELRRLRKDSTLDVAGDRQPRPAPRAVVWLWWRIAGRADTTGGPGHPATQ